MTSTDTSGSLGTVSAPRESLAIRESTNAKYDPASPGLIAQLLARMDGFIGSLGRTGFESLIEPLGKIGDRPVGVTNTLSTEVGKLR
jgi:hypothetical protein